MQTRSFALAVLCLLGITPVSGSAAILTFAFEGHITNKQDPLGLLTFAAVGDQVLYTFSFDSDDLGTRPVPTYAYYSGLSSESKVRGFEFVSGIPSILIQHPLDLFDVSARFDVGFPGLQPDGFVLFRLSDQRESNALSSVDLPLVPYDLVPFSERAFSFSFYVPRPGGSSERIGFSGLIDRFVPEPNTLVLMMSAAILLSRGPRRL